MKGDESHTVLIAGKNKETTLGMGNAKEQWKKFGPDGDNARIKFLQELQKMFDDLAKEFPGRVTFGDVSKDLASERNYVVWGANKDNVGGEKGAPISGTGQAKLMESHGPGVFGIITTPVAGIP